MSFCSMTVDSSGWFMALNSQQAFFGTRPTIATSFNSQLWPVSPSPGCQREKWDGMRIQTAITTKLSLKNIKWNADFFRIQGLMLMFSHVFGANISHWFISSHPHVYTATDLLKTPQSLKRLVWVRWSCWPHGRSVGSCNVRPLTKWKNVATVQSPPYSIL